MASIQFAKHIIEWLPEFALKHSELTDMHSGNAVQLLRDAAKRVYESEKFENSSKFGELLLHQPTPKSSTRNQQFRRSSTNPPERHRQRL